MAESISPSQARKKLESGAGYVDVRSAGEYAAGHVPGSVNIPLDHLQERYDDLPKEGDLIVACASGGRSSRAIELLEGNVSCQLHNLTGGYNAWEAQGLPIVIAEGAPWSLERQVMFTAGSVALAGLVIGKVIPPARRMSWLVSGGLVFAGASGNCYLKKALMKAPWNQHPDEWKDKADQWRQQARQKAEELGQQAGDKAKEVGGDLGHKAKDAAYALKDKVTHRGEGEGEGENEDAHESPSH